MSTTDKEGDKIKHPFMTQISICQECEEAYSIC